MLVRTAFVIALAAVTAAAQPASLAGFKDRGTFHVFVNEDRVATTTFEWSAGGAYKGETTIRMGGQSLTIPDAVEVDAEGRWVRLETKGPQGPVTAVREGETARRTFKDKTEIIKVKPGALLFGNYAPALMALAVKNYDRTKGGKQAVDVVVIPGMAIEGSVEYKDKVERSAAGKDLALDRFVYSMQGVDIIVYAGADAKVYLADVPVQHAAYIREGYEALRKTDADPLLSQPEHDVVSETVMTPMRDGVKLATAVWRPKADGKFPSILIRTPYKKEMMELQARYYARRGYAVAVQDCRGRFGSEGVWEPFVNERKDGYDGVEWTAAQPWSNGKVGMIGGSYVGWVQWWAAVERPPHMVTIIPNVAPPDPFYNIPYEHGAFFILGSIWWADILESNATADLSGAALSKIGEKKYNTLLKPLPVIDLDKAILGKENPYWRKWIAHPANDSYWARANFLEELKSVRIPVFHQSGWFDGDGIGTKLNYLRMKEFGAPNQKLILGPWGHTATAQRRLGDRDFGDQAVAIDLEREYLRWFDYWLKGVDNGILKDPLVKIFVMGQNKWLSGPSYPLPETRFEKWYLASGGGANTSKGDGVLSAEPPKPKARADEYIYDPGDPTPDPTYYEESAEEEMKVKTADDRKKEREAHHVQVTDARKDILVYTTEPLKAPLTFAGPVSAVLWASSSARDTDWHMRLIEIDKDGKTYQLVAGRVRARFRNSTTKPELLKPGRAYEYRIDLWQTGTTIPAGHRLRVEVASAAFPMWSRNLNTGGHNEVETKYVKASQTVYHDAQHPSHILLPVIP